ncbi:hypothetical protein F5B21DRAFT_112038 [Xylaria acuta]|nr:hypothetical protein F5B21DRAFT_112038 [Xylaria acuta]
MAHAYEGTPTSPSTSVTRASMMTALESMNHEIALRWYGNLHRHKPPGPIRSSVQTVMSHIYQRCSFDSVELSTILENETRKRHVERRLLDGFSWWWWWEIGSLLISVTSLITLLSVLAGYRGHALSDWRLPPQPNSAISVLTTVMKTTILLSISASFSQLKWHHFSTPQLLNDLETFNEASRGPWGSFLLLLQCRRWSLLATGLAITTLASLLVEPTAQQILDFPSRETVLRGTDAGIMNSYGFRLRISNDSDDIFFSKTLGIRSSLVGAATGNISPFSFSCPNTAVRCTYPAFTTLGVCSSFHNTTDPLRQSCTNNQTTGTISCNISLPSIWDEIEEFITSG